ncbi:dihydrofolate synthase / folylpolyglutamate synthase [Arachidicoccus rhizosphaerae]|uniref:Dihydrofolate synthase/folylpolyglutamate synthase n=1 Tax=Arachidicoccus rhizosphaerae TaxID=551991 RepID=A0A1H3VZK1_9BACT|nr:folylpolyglutamate synthase/dihydrofolate synthase family protein [Arachidicoccus rhizosphaerae]SDZ80243.1 dihydrofolate synthase / folylpolyglutamate synthase [Arachidicoccus rhizosphaerae]
MDYKETIDFLFQQLPMFSRDGASAFKKDLSNTLALCAALEAPQTKFKSIHIAGTNGKGSSSHMLAAVFQKAGYKTGLYTSPHLYDFRERIRVNGMLCTEEFVVRFVERIKPELDEIQPSFFEITVAMAFAYFVEQKVDIAIIETGLGGRLDSTNVVLPELSLITNIGFDHMQFLGNTLPEIATEKAGIIKKNRPVVISEYLPETKTVFEKTAANLKSPIFFAQDLWCVKENENYNITADQQDLPALCINAIRQGVGPDDLSCDYQLDLTGHYQLKNAQGVLETIYQMRRLGWSIPLDAVHEGLKQVKKLTGFVGRWDQVLTDPWMIADVGHNVDGIRMIKEQLSHMQYKNLHIITGFVKDKDVSASLKELPQTANYYFTQAPIPRALDAALLKNMAESFNLKGKDFADISAAIKAAIAAYQKGDLILICGSVFLVAEIKGALNKLGLS